MDTVERYPAWQCRYVHCIPCARYGWGGGLQSRLPGLLQARWTHACGLVRLGGREAVIVVGGRVTSGQGDELSSGEAEGFYAYVWYHCFGRIPDDLTFLSLLPILCKT